MSIAMFEGYRKRRTTRKSAKRSRKGTGSKLARAAKACGKGKFRSLKFRSFKSCVKSKAKK